MTTVRELLKWKGSKVSSIHPDATVFEAVEKMADQDIGSLAVIDGEKLVGIIAERHYARKVVLKGKRSAETPVRDIMEDVIAVRPEQSVEECMAIMTERRIRHLPVLEGEQLIGIISIGDLVKSIISNQKFIISQLEHYIHGEGYVDFAQH